MNQPGSTRVIAVLGVSEICLMGFLAGCGRAARRTTAASVAPASASSSSVPAGPSPVTSSGGTGVQSPDSTTRSAATPSGSNRSSPASSPPTSAPSSCNPATLGISLVTTQGAGGSGYYYFAAENHGTQICQAGGYFGPAIYDQAGRLLNATPGRMATTLSGVSAQPVPVAPDSQPTPRRITATSMTTPAC